MFGLKLKQINEINKIFSKYNNIDQVYIYGSRALGNYKNGSDIDLTFKGKNLNLSILNKISLDLDDLLLPYTFDLSIYEHIDNKELIKHINDFSKIFYKKNTAN